jgi:flagellar assembly protein FliH
MTIQNSIIPAEQSAEFSSWQMPEVKDGQVVCTEKMQKRGPRGELVNVDKKEVIYSSLTAGQLEEISNQAYEEVREQACKDGHKQGYIEGRQEGVEAGKKIIAERTAALNSVIEQLYSFLSGQDDEVEQALVNLASCVSKSVLRRELTTDSSHIKQVVLEAIATLPMDPKNIQIFLSEQDHQLLSSQTEISDQWTLRVDPCLTPGGCRLTTDHSVVDYTLEEQFQQSINTLVEERFSLLAEQAKARVEPDGS